MSKCIPKVIHYCWFGGKPLPEDVKRYIESWKKYCPDYEIVEWNENNFDINSNAYVKEAYEAKKWAFVTDYVRLYALYNNGGIYMDTDVELVAPIDCFLENHAFSGFESNNNALTGIMASEKKFELFGEFMEYYNNRHFAKEDGSFDMTTNVKIATDICKKYGLIENNKLQNIKGFVLYPSEVFCPKNMSTGVIHKTKNTVAIHHFSGSWLNNGDIKLRRIRRKICKKYGEAVGNFLYKTVYVPYRFYTHVNSLGIKHTLMGLIKK